MFKTIQRLRTIGLFEGISFLLLLFIAMPLKYMADMPMAVSIVGAAHGFLFVVYAGLALNAVLDGMSKQMGFYCILAAIFPFGPFVLDKHLKSLSQEIQNRSTP